MKRVLSFVLAAACLVTCLSGAAAAAEKDGSLSNFNIVAEYKDGTFSDIIPGEWYENNVAAAYELGLMKGNEDGTFNPSGNITYAEMLVLACKLHSIFYTGVADLELGNPWYSNYVLYALRNGIIDVEYEDYNAAVGRGEFAGVLAKALPASTMPCIREIEDNQIPDVKTGADNYDAIYRLYRAGILSGNNERGTFTPGAPIQRSAVAAIITRMVYRSLRSKTPLEKFGGSDLEEGQRLEDDFFSNAAMLGNSLVQGMSLSCNLRDTMKFYCYQSLTVYSIVNKGYVADLCKNTFDKVYIELGINEIYMDLDDYTTQYGKIIDTIREAMPDADIYIMAVTPVTRAVSDNGSFTMKRIREMNEALHELAENKECLYLDCCENLCGSDGYLKESYKGWDGSPHLSASGYLAWEEVMRTYYKD